MAGALAATAFVSLAAPALAHTGEEISDATAWSTWEVTPDILIPTILLVAIYLAGMARRKSVSTPVPTARHIMFFAGLATIFLALQSPVDAIAEHLFFVHQIQHLMLRMLGPMLLALAWPGGLLTAGTPPALRRVLVVPVISNGGLRAVVQFLMRPIVVTALFVAALYVWEFPAYHNLALLNEPVHYAMHVTMLLAGLAFWWCVFDRRPPVSPFDMDHDQPWWRLFGPGSPHGLRYGVRLMMIWVVALSNIVLGAFTALKQGVLYPAYDVLGRLFGVSGATDEQVGGFIIWMPSAMMCLIAILVIVHWMAVRETQLDVRARLLSGSNSAAALVPTTGAELIARARPKNRAMAVGFGLFVVSVFLTALLVGAMANPASLMGGSAQHARLAHMDAIATLQ